MSEIIYRSAEPKDAIRLAEMRCQFLVEISSRKTEESKKKLKEQLKEYFEKELTRENVVVWVAELNQEVIATSTMVIWQPPIGFSGIDKEGNGYILNMFVVQAYRKKGIGALLMEKLIDVAKSKNLEKIHLHATNDGMHLYRKNGFHVPTYPELVLNLVDSEN